MKQKEWSEFFSTDETSQRVTYCTKENLGKFSDPEFDKFPKTKARFSIWIFQFERRISNQDFYSEIWILEKLANPNKPDKL